MICTSTYSMKSSSSLRNPQPLHFSLSSLEESMLSTSARTLSATLTQIWDVRPTRKVCVHYSEEIRSNTTACLRCSQAKRRTSASLFSGSVAEFNKSRLPKRLCRLRSSRCQSVLCTLWYHLRLRSRFCSCHRSLQRESYL